MIKGIGCDAVDIFRIEKVMQSTRFIDKVYTQYEQACIKTSLFIPRWASGRRKKRSAKFREQDLQDLQ